MGTSRNSGGQTGGHVLKFLKNKKIHTFSKNLSLCSLKLLVMILFKVISCYHLPEVVNFILYGKYC